MFFHFSLLDSSSSSSSSSSPDSLLYSSFPPDTCPAFLLPSPASSSSSLHCGGPELDSPTGSGSRRGSTEVSEAQMPFSLTNSFSAQVNNSSPPPGLSFKTRCRLHRFLSAGRLRPERRLPGAGGGRGAEEALPGVWRLRLWLSLRRGVLRGLQGVLQEDRPR